MWLCSLKFTEKEKKEKERDETFTNEESMLEIHVQKTGEKYNLVFLNELKETKKVIQLWTNNINQNHKISEMRGLEKSKMGKQK